MLKDALIIIAGGRHPKYPILQDDKTKIQPLWSQDFFVPFVSLVPTTALPGTHVLNETF